MINFKHFTTDSGEIIYYIGTPDLKKVEELASSNGDVWHSSSEQGFSNLFNELSAITHVAWWYINDFSISNDISISWRVNINEFAIRKSVWDDFSFEDNEFDTSIVKGLALGYDLLNFGAITLNVKGLFSKSNQNDVKISYDDFYKFVRNRFGLKNLILLHFRKKTFYFSLLLKNILFSSKHVLNSTEKKKSIKKLINLENSPSVSYILPTMHRSDYVLQLLDDLNNQTLIPKEVIVIDATPNLNVDFLLENKTFNFDLIYKLQNSIGSCRARNEAIELVTSDFIIFGDDDIRILPDFIENHIKFLKTNKINACNGLDIRADNPSQNLKDLKIKFEALPLKDAGISFNFSNANSCVKTSTVKKIIGNDVNYDGGYGEDADFGIRLVKTGEVVLKNPYSPILHLKPNLGGYRWWGNPKIFSGKNRKLKPWEGSHPVKYIKPVPSPTILYQILTHYNSEQLKDYKFKYFFIYLFRGSKYLFFLRVFNLPYKFLQFSKSMFYARNLFKNGIKYK